MTHELYESQFIVIPLSCFMQVRNTFYNINYTGQFLQIPGFIHWSLFIFTEVNECERWMNSSICKNWSVWWFYHICTKVQIPLLVFVLSAKSENTIIIVTMHSICDKSLIFVIPSVMTSYLNQTILYMNLSEGTRSTREFSQGKNLVWRFQVLSEPTK